MFFDERGKGGGGAGGGGEVQNLLRVKTHNLLGLQAK